MPSDLFHTHSSDSDAKKEEPKDMRNSDKYEFNTYTLTPTGLYLYKPHTSGEVKIADGLDILKPCNRNYARFGFSDAITELHEKNEIRIIFSVTC
jgi:hypothetical protein